MSIDLNKLGDIPTAKLKDLFSQRTLLDAPRELMLAELSRREQKKETRDRRNHIFQWVIVVLSAFIFIFTSITFVSSFFNDKNSVVPKLPTAKPDKIQGETTNNKPKTDNNNFKIK